MIQEKALHISSNFIGKSKIPQTRLLERNGKLYAEFYYEGDRIRKSLDTSDLTEAKRKTKLAVADEINRRISLKCPLIKHFYDVYSSNTLAKRRQASPSTKIKNINCMERVLRFYEIDSAQQDIRHFAKKTEHGIPICEDFVHKNGPDCMRMARSLFSKEWIKFYKRAGIDTSWFANWISLSLEAPIIQPFYRNELEEELIILKCESLKETDIDIYKAYALAYGLGLRSSEILRARYSDFWKTGTSHVITIRKPKCGGDVQNRVCDPYWWNEIKSLKTGEDDLIITCQKDRVVREFPQFLREECKVDDKRPVHKLRKMAGDRVMRLNGNSIYVAKEVLGHRSIDITSKIYAGFPDVKASR
jgi:integrase